MKYIEKEGIIMAKVTTLTPEEIAELEKAPSEVAREKIAATGSKEALEAFDQYVGMFKGVHDGYLLQANAAESALYKEVGADKYLEYMHDCFYNSNSPFMQGFWDKPFKERAMIAINAPRMFHDCRMKILGEDDEKLWFVMEPCGAGQKLWEMGMCKPGCGLCDEPHAITAGGKNFPVYCTHAPIAEIVCGELGIPYMYQQEYPEQVGPCSCVFYVYKDPKDIPDSYFERVGAKRPEICKK